MSAAESGSWCAGCGQPILANQSVIRLEAGLLHAESRFDPLVLRPVAYLHAGAGYDAVNDLEDRWCATPEGLAAAVLIVGVHGQTSPSGH